MKKATLQFTRKELAILAHVGRQLADHMCWDDRPDHGLNNLKGYRDLSQEQKDQVMMLFARINRLFYNKKWD